MMDTAEGYDIAERLMVEIGNASDEDFFCIMSCLFRLKNKEAQRERDEWEDYQEEAG